MVQKTKLEGRQLCSEEQARQVSDEQAPHEQTGASPSNTAPANYTELQILRSGIDSLYVSYQGELRSEIEETLEARKLAAQSSDAETQKESTILLSDQPFAVLGKGRGYFPYVLTNNWYHLQVSRALARQIPLAYVQIGSELLTHTKLGDVMGSLNLVAEVLTGKVVSPSVSRVDLCTDFVTTADLEALPRLNWVTRAENFTQYHVGGQFSGYTFGAGGPVSCRIYNKTLEIKKSKKEYLFPIWKEQGWDGVSDVWRLEFQLRGDALREFKAQSIKEMTAQMNAIWHYCSTKWLKLCKPSGKNQSRWLLNPLWEALSQSQFNDEPAGELRRIRKHMAPSDHSLFVHGLGGLTSYMAREGIDDLAEAMERYLQEAHAFHRRYSQHNGKTLATYVREKVQKKRTQFSARQLGEYDKKSRGLKEDV